jgi:hypothetical protein
MTARGVFVICWLGCVFWALTAHPGESHPWMRGSFIAASAIVLFVIAAWGQPEAIPQSFGTLIPRRKLLFSENETGASPELEIGDSGTGFSWSGPAGKPMLELVAGSHLIIESIGGRIKVSTQLRDKRGDLVAELIRNDWKVSPLAWDRNYSDDALEVRNSQGRVVLQVRVIPGKIQLQGEWWDEHGNGTRLVKCPDRQTGKMGGCVVQLGLIDSPDQQIIPMFQYPSELHFGELAYP